MSLEPSALAQACAATMWANDRASQAMGMAIEDIGPGIARVSMPLRPDMLNGQGNCHGGLIATLADSAFAFACNSYGTVTVAAGFEVNFLNPAALGEPLVAEAHEVARRGRSGIYDVTVRQGETVIAEFRGRSRSLGKSLLEG